MKPRIKAMTWNIRKEKTASVFVMKNYKKKKESKEMRIV